MRAHRAQFAGRLPTVHSWHDQVHENDVRYSSLRQAEGRSLLAARAMTRKSARANFRPIIRQVVSAIYCQWFALDLDKVFVHDGGGSRIEKGRVHHPMAPVAGGFAGAAEDRVEINPAQGACHLR